MTLSAIDPLTHHFINCKVYTFYVHVISLICRKRNRNRLLKNPSLFQIELIHCNKMFYKYTLLSFIAVSQQFKLKLISAQFLLPMISCNELYNTIYSVVKTASARINLSVVVNSMFTTNRQN